MSDREQVISLLNHVPDHKVRYVLAYLQGLTADEEADDAFCKKLLEDYEEDPDPTKDETFSLEACKAQWGITG